MGSEVNVSPRSGSRPIIGSLHDYIQLYICNYIMHVNYVKCFVVSSHHCISDYLRVLIQCLLQLFRIHNGMTAIVFIAGHSEVSCTYFGNIRNKIFY